jgi:putative sterol carrier protein
LITTVEEAVKRMEAGFWRRYHANPELQKKLAGKSRVIQLAVPDAESYWFHIHDGKLHEIQQGAHPKPDATVTATKKDLLAVFNGELKAMQAYLTGKVKVKASFSDLLFAKSLIG